MLDKLYGNILCDFQLYFAHLLKLFWKMLRCSRNVLLTLKTHPTFQRNQCSKICGEFSFLGEFIEMSR